MADGFFKVHCLAVMDEVQAKRETVVIKTRQTSREADPGRQRLRRHLTIFSPARV